MSLSFSGAPSAYGASGSNDATEASAYFAAYAQAQQSYQYPYQQQQQAQQSFYQGAYDPYAAGGGGGGAYGYGAAAYSGYPPMSAHTYSAPYPPQDGGCRDYRAGRCTRGNTCRFAHIGVPFRAPGGHDMCGDFLAGRCARGETCRFSHDKGAGMPCRDYLKGLCTRGDGCRYSHADGAPLPVCRSFLRGHCARQDCKYVHDLNDRTAAQIGSQSSYVSPSSVGFVQQASPTAAASASASAVFTAPTIQLPSNEAKEGDAMVAPAMRSRKRGRDKEQEQEERPAKQARSSSKDKPKDVDESPDSAN
jgi:hypothetical protein